MGKLYRDGGECIWPMAMLALVLMLALVMLAGCATVKESTTTESTTVTAVRDTTETHVVVIPPDTSSALLTPAVDTTANQPDTILQGVTRAGVSVRVNTRTRVATVVTPQDTVKVVDKDTLSTSTTTTVTQTEVRSGDSWWQNIRDYVTGAVLFVLLAGVLAIVLKLGGKSIKPW